MEGWSAAEPLPESWLGPSLGYDGSGRATVGYAQLVSTAPVATRVAIADSRAADDWVDGFEVLSGPGDFPSLITLAVGPDGTAAACITSITAPTATATLRHRVLYRTAGSTEWEDPVDIVERSEQSGSIPLRRVLVTPNGITVVLVDRFDGPPDNRIRSIVVSSHPPGGTWTAPQQVNPAGKHVDMTDLGIDADGNATIAWVHQWQATPSKLTSIRVVTRSAATGALGQPATLTAESGTANVSNVRVAVNASGAAALGTQMRIDGTDGHHAAVTTRATQLGGWKPMTALFTAATAASSSPNAIGISNAGTGYVLYWRQGPMLATNDVIGVSRSINGTWDPPSNLSVTNMNTSDGTIVFRGDDAFLIYTGAIGFGGGNPGVGVFQASRWRPGAAAPEPPTDILPQGTRINLGQAVSDNAGSLVVTHDVIGGETRRTFVTTFDRFLAPRFRFSMPGPVNGVAFSPDGTLLAAAADKAVRVFDLATGQKRFELTHSARVNAVVFTPDGLAVATASDDATARVTTIASGSQLTVVNHDGPVTVLAVSRDGHRLATGGADGAARLSEIGAGTPPRRLRLDGAATGLAFNPDGSLLAIACDDSTARVFGTQTGATLLTLAHGGAVRAVTFDGGGTRLATASADRNARVFDPSSGGILLTLLHGGPVNGVSFDGNGTLLATAVDDGTSRIVNAQSGINQLTLRHGAAVSAVAFSRDNRITTATAEEIVYIYDKAGAQQARLRHNCPVHGIAFRPDGTMLATAGDDKIVRVFALDQL